MNVQCKHRIEIEYITIATERCLSEVTGDDRSEYSQMITWVRVCCALV